MDEYIETIGLFYERFGLSRMSGRILGYLMSSPEESVSFEDIRTQLRASKGSISGNINFLLAQGIINRTMKSGDRKTYYSFSAKCVYKVFDQKVQSITEMKKLFINANEISNNPLLNKYKQISETIEFYDFLESELPKLKEKWKQHKKNNNEE